MKILIVNISHKEEVINHVKQMMTNQTIKYDEIEVRDDFQKCVVCGKCIKKRKCIFDDVINEIHDVNYDGLFLIADTQYGKVDHKVHSFMQRLMRSENEQWLNKVGGVILVGRHHNTKDAMQEVLDYYRYGSMICALDRYHHTYIDDIEVVEKSVNQMIWLMKCLAEASQSDITSPIQEIDKVTDFVR